MADAGAVNILYGTAGGLDTIGNQFFSQATPGMLGVINPGSQFGFALASGDFDGDGEDDLAIGDPGETVNGLNNAGAVNVVYGSNAGLIVAGNQLWSQDSFGILGVADALDHFGFALASGDYDGDGEDDLAVGVPDEDINGLVDAGAVNVIYGSAGGLNQAGDQLWNQDSFGILGVADAGDRFGFALASGDFDGDDEDDLAVGVPNEDVNGIVDAGVVNVLYGSAGGLTDLGNQRWHQNSTGIEDSAEADDFFGSTLGTGDFDGDGDDDLAVGVPGEDLGNLVDAGAVNVVYGTSTGLDAASDQFWNQDTVNIFDNAEPNDAFGG